MSTVPAGSGETSDAALAESGKRLIESAFHWMPVLQSIRKQFIKTQPLAGKRIIACRHVTPANANLLVALRDGGADVAFSSAESQTTCEEVAASLSVHFGMPRLGETAEDADGSRQRLADTHILLDHRCRLVSAMRAEPGPRQGFGITEDDPQGTRLLRQLEASGRLRCPAISLGDSALYRLLTRRFGLERTALETVERETGMLIAGTTVVVSGYGWSGQWLAHRARTEGANVIVTEVDPVRAVEAAMEGFQLTTMAEAARVGDVFLPVTGNRSVLTREHFDRMRNGAVMAVTAGRPSEVDLDALGRSSLAQRDCGESLVEYSTRDGRRLRVVLLDRAAVTAASREPAAVSDIACSLQALSCEFLARNSGALENRVLGVPDNIERTVARLKVESSGIKLDRLTLEQEQFLATAHGI